MSRSFLEDKRLVFEELSAQGTLRKVPVGKLEQFSTDLCLIAHGIRSAYLVDAFALEDTVSLFSCVLVSLRFKRASFGDVVHWYDPSSLQSFIVNRRILCAFAEALLEEYTTVTYVLLDACPIPLNSTPEAVLDILRLMNANMLESPANISFSFADGLTQEILVPLAATLINYPVAYVPVSAVQTSFLAGQPLDVYEVVVLPETSRAPESSVRTFRQHILLKFSCPCSLAERDHELSPGRITNRLQVQFQERLSSIGLSLSVHHQVEILERVAL